MSVSALKKYSKPVLVSLGVLMAAAAAGVFLYAKIYLTAPVIESTLRRNVQEQLRRELAFREIEVSLFQGIHLRGVTIGKSLAGETDDFFTCDEIAMDVGFWPLLFKKLVIRSLAITNPRLNLQSAGGRPFSVSGAVRAAAGAVPELELLLLPGSIMVSGGTVSLSDTQENIGFELTNIRLDAGSISYILPFDVTASAGFSGSSTDDIQLKGTYSIASQKFSVQLLLPDADFGRFQPLFAASGIPLSRGTASIELSVKGKGDAPIELSGKISVKDAGLELLAVQKADDDIGLSGLTAELNIQAEYDQVTGNAEIKKLHGRILNSPFEGSGSLRAADAGSLQLHLLADRLSLDDLSGRLYYGSASPFQGLRLSGFVSLGIDMSSRAGRSQFPIITLKLHDNHIIYPALGSLQPELSGTLTFDSRAITLTELRFGTKSLGIVLAGSLVNYLLWPPQADIRVVSSDFNYYEIFNSPDSRKGEDIGPFDFGTLKFDGPIELGDVSFLNLDLAGVQGAYLFEKNRFSIHDFRGGIKQGGSFDLGTSIDLGVKGFAYNLKLAIADVPAQKVGELAGIDFSQFMDGVVSGTAYISARGTRSTTFTDNLAGDAALKIKGCRIRGFALPEQLNRFIKQDALNQLNFTDADVQLKLRGPSIELSGAFVSPQAELYTAGEIGLNAELNIQAQLKLATDIFSTETRIAEYLPREGSWVVLPVVIKGAFDKPAVTLTDDAIRHIMQETLPRLFMDMLEKSRTKDAPAEAEE